MQIPSQFQHVKQPPNSRLCGTACCAMAVGKTLDQVLAEADWKELTYTSGIARFLARHGVTMGLWFPWVGRFPATFDFEVTPKGRPAILAVKSDHYEKADHWVFWDGTKILDPAPAEQEKYHVLELHFLSYWPDPEWLPELEKAEWWELAR